MKLKGDNMCFACGKDNPISLGLEFSLYENNKVEAEFIPAPEHQGYDNIMHGGLISTLLDEAMAKVLYLQGIRAVTAEIKVRFKGAVFIGERLNIYGELIKRHKKLLFTRAFLYNDKGEKLAESEAKFIEVQGGDN